MRWPIIIVGMLSGHVGAMVLAVNVASGDSGSGNGHSVLPSYYERAVQWDESRAALARSVELGWQATISPAVFADQAGVRSVVIEMRDAEGAPLTGLLVQAKAWHHAIGEIQEGEAAALTGADGTYRVSLPMERAGQWSFEILATRGDDAFVSQSTLDLASASSLLGTPAGGSPR